MTGATTMPDWIPFGRDGFVCILAFITALVVAAIATLPARWLALRLGAIDQPGGRRIHARPTARLGGLAVLVAVWLGSAVALGAEAMPLGEFDDRWRSVLPILVIGAGVCALGALDDVRGLSPMAKLAGLAAAAVALPLCGVRIDFLALPGADRFELAWLALPATVLWVLACTNAVNLIDGVDGAGSGVATVSAFVLALVALGVGDPVSAVLLAAVAGASSGFLLHNRHPATIFLGDSGSLLLGFLLAAISAAGSTKRATALLLTAALLALAVPFTDSAQSFLRRFRRARAADDVRSLRGALRATTVADHGHIHHRLLGRGLSHSQVARVLSLVTLALGLSALLMLPSERPSLRAFAGATLASAYMLLRLSALRPATRADDSSAPREPTVVLPSPDRDDVLIPQPPRAPAAQRRRPHATPQSLSRSES